MSLAGGHYDILTEKYEFGTEDLIAYIGGYLVSKIINKKYPVLIAFTFRVFSLVRA